jgi:hypothetical protein
VVLQRLFLGVFVPKLEPLLGQILHLFALKVREVLHQVLVQRFVKEDDLHALWGVEE